MELIGGGAAMRLARAFTRPGWACPSLSLNPRFVGRVTGCMVCRGGAVPAGPPSQAIAGRSGWRSPAGDGRGMQTSDVPSPPPAAGSDEGAGRGDGGRWRPHAAQGRVHRLTPRFSAEELEEVKRAAASI